MKEEGTDISVQPWSRLGGGWLDSDGAVLGSDGGDVAMREQEATPNVRSV